jgi:hypothetical protein
LISMVLRITLSGGPVCGDALFGDKPIRFIPAVTLDIS